MLFKTRKKNKKTGEEWPTLYEVSMTTPGCYYLTWQSRARNSHNNNKNKIIFKFLVWTKLINTRETRTGKTGPQECVQLKHTHTH